MYFITLHWEFGNSYILQPVWRDGRQSYLSEGILDEHCAFQALFRREALLSLRFKPFCFSLETDAGIYNL